MPDTDFQIQIHADRRLIEVRYPAKPNAASYARYERDIRAAIEGMRGEQWDCLVDQSQLTMMPPELPPKIAELNAWAKANGMRRTARVVRDSATAQLQVNRILKASGVAQVGAIYATRDDAWAALTQP